MLEYTINTTTEEELYKYLLEQDNCFIPSLSKRVDIKQYSKKLFNNSTRFEAWNDTLLIGFVAVYINDISSYISLVTVVPMYCKKHIGSQLLVNCIQYVKGKNYQEIQLEVNRSNKTAIAFYKKHCFFKESYNKESVFMKLYIVK